MNGAAATRSGSRTVARKLALQALYRWQLNAAPWQDLVSEFAEAEDMARADAAYFRALVEAVTAAREELDAALAPLLDRPPAQLDPIEHAVLLIGAHELRGRPEVPFRVVINEAVTLAKRFGATDGHRYINGVLDRGARLWRAQEH
ncbi:MAG: transcription antitermination factor NusB [Gammaproteobacteria bacterium]|nr:transcription antitermination factor NusB [Gammaproteobacteria bacterium]